MNPLLALLAFGGLAVGFVAGRQSAPAPTGSAPTPAALLRPIPVQSVQGQAPDDPRELIPLVPGPNNGTEQGQSPGPQQPGQAPGQGECNVLMFKDGQMYRLQPGVPLPGQEPGQGQPGGDNELLPLQPFNQPLPQPDQPAPSQPDLRV
ncbi:hypothetical protein [Deinococcus apachensis]|uniref:hypothetical protein n=1 Tax=Deinococcus apachensis TaxID=309886 RepID=UPI00036FBAF5|nr:hypothetical protein [Deinococcus apachensis]